MFVTLMQGVGLNAQVDTDLPRVLSELVGKTYTFQLKLKDFNFTANHQTFTISRIFPARDLASEHQLCHVFNRKMLRFTSKPIFRMWHREQMTELQTRPMLQRCPPQVVKQKRMKTMLRKITPLRKHEWNEYHRRIQTTSLNQLLFSSFSFAFAGFFFF